jgi:hypothetical protein
LCVQKAGLLYNDQPPLGPSKIYKNIAQKISDVELVVMRLKEKHASLYSVEKLNARAHMIDIGKHDSYDVPPDLPYFRGRITKSPTTPGSSPQPVTSCSASPSKRISMRTQLLSQMEKWHTLLEKGGITQAQYNQQFLRTSTVKPSTRIYNRNG